MPQRYGFLLLPRFSLLSLAGMLEVLTAANELLGDRHYECLLLSAEGVPVAAACGTVLEAACSAVEAPDLDALFVVSDLPLPESADAGVQQLLRRHAEAGAALGGVGTGAALLAAAGVLGGHRATLHWPHVSLVAERHDDTVFSRHWFEIDRQRLSCAGGGASIDMLLAWLGRQHGERLAHEIAAHIGLERVRAGDERQRSPVHARIAGGAPKLAEAVALMEANIGEPLPTEDIARLVGVSRRQLERLFKQHLNDLPSRYYLSLRLARARRLLQQTGQSILQVGLGCGFSSGPHFSNAYKAHFGRTPREERSQRAAAWRASQPAPAPQDIAS